jgi:hypothetical protein
LDGGADSGRTGRERTASSRRLVEIRCGFAELARREADLAAARLADANRRAEAQLAVLAEVQTLADPATARGSKEQAHRNFKGAVMAARDHAAVESAAHSWLMEINRINGQLRKAKVRLRRERETADSLMAERERLTATSEAARDMAEAARQACLEAQGALAIVDLTDEDDEALEVAGMAGGWISTAAAAAPPGPAGDGAGSVVASAPVTLAGADMAATASAADVPVMGPWAPPTSDFAGPEASAPAGGAFASAPTDGLALNLRARPPQLIVRLLHRDSPTLNWLVDGLAGTSPNARSAWKLQLSNLVDAAVASAIDDACFEFPPGNPFWDLFEPDQAREIARGLAALGFRYDGFGSFVDGRIPDQRDLALAIGSAGLIPVRIRYWPRPGETAHLFVDVRVATEIYLESKAPELTLGEMVVALGRRAELLADLWNEWDRVRPLLLSNPSF